MSFVLCVNTAVCSSDTYSPRNTAGDHHSTRAEHHRGATSAVDDLSKCSAIPTAFYARKISDYTKKLMKEQEMREHLENKIRRLRRQVNDNSKLIDM